MNPLIYVRLVGFTLGTLLQLFWMVVILGYRRQRNLERVFFFVCLALFLFYGGSLLALNAQIYYSAPPLGLRAFAIAVIVAALCLLPALLLHLHMEFGETRGLLKDKRWKRAALLLFYAAGAHLAIHHIPIHITSPNFDFTLPAKSLGEGFRWLFALALLWCASWQFRFYRNTQVQAERYFYGLLTWISIFSIVGVLAVHLGIFALKPWARDILSSVFALIPILPSGALIYLVQRHNFLQIGTQKNLLYAVSATFLALLYLSLVRRVGLWLEPMLPPEASAAMLLFVLVIFIEPLQRLLGRRLQETAQREMDRVQRLTGEIQQEARQGDLTRLMHFIARCVKEEFDLAWVSLDPIDHSQGRLRPVTLQEKEQNVERSGQVFLVRQSERPIAVMRAEPHGALLSGETRAALAFLCEQLPASLDLCRLIEDKLRLERELAERERLALVGQMAASISHNLKNPLGSIKTILQVQMENRELPESLRGETKIVLDEVGRLSARLNQLLQFSRPTVRGGSIAASCDVSAVIEEVAGVLRHEAERRGVALQTQLPQGGTKAAVPADALSDILSNLLVNALEATPRGGHVSVCVSGGNGSCMLTVEDDGSGIPSAARDKILKPFFTTKTQGTGLGLAIVARRVAEFGGKLQWKSPVNNGRGTRFEVSLPLACVQQG